MPSLLDIVRVMIVGMSLTIIVAGMALVMLNCWNGTLDVDCRGIMSADEPNYLAWISTAAAAIFAVLTGAISKLWLKTVDDSKTLLTDAKIREATLATENASLKKEFETRLIAAEDKIDAQIAEVKDCHKQREELRVELSSVKTRLEIIENHMECTRKEQ